MMDTTMKLAATTSVHKPCAFNPNGANEEMCKQLSGTPTRAVRCEAAKCTSRWRVKSVIAAKKEPVHLTSDALMRLEERRAAQTPATVTQLPVAVKSAPPLVRVTAPPPPASVSETEEGDEWRKVLDRVKVAMANSELVSVDPKVVQPMLGQPREFFNESSLANLCKSIREVGQIQAGIIRRIKGAPNGICYELLDGERRWRAVTIEQVSFYRAQLVDIDDAAAPYMIAAIANFNRDGHTPMEISDAIHKLRSGPVRFPIAAIADMFGFSENWTYQMAGLQNLHQKVRVMLDPNQSRDRQLPVLAAVHISKLDRELQPELANRVLAKEITVARLRRAVVETGAAHGKPVRTREIEPRKLYKSLFNRSGESARLAGDMLEAINEMKRRDLLPQPGTERAKVVVTAIEAAMRGLMTARDVLKG